MEKIKKILILVQFLLLVSWSQILHANTIIVPSNDGGGFARSSNEMLPHVKSLGIKDISILGSCLRGTNHFNKSNDKNIIWQYNFLPLTTGCEIPITKSNFLGIAKMESFMVVYRSDKKGLSLEDFISSQHQRVIGTNTTSWGPINDLTKNVWKNKNKVIWLGNSKDVVSSLLGNDVDYQIVLTAWAVQNLDKVTPILSLGDKNDIISELPKLPNLYTVVPGYQHSIVEYYWLLISNVDEKEAKKMRKDFEKIKRSDGLKKAFFRSGVRPFEGDTEKQITAINNLVDSTRKWSIQLKETEKNKK